MTLAVFLFVDDMGVSHADNDMIKLGVFHSRKLGGDVLEGSACYEE